VRLDAKRSAQTRILFCTVGILLRQMVNGLDEKVTCIVVDEVHERDRLADFLLIILRRLLPSRPHLRVVLMSATINADMFCNYFNGECLFVFRLQMSSFFLMSAPV
jgi:ATP-dependent RNA helicase DHX36